MASLSQALHTKWQVCHMLDFAHISCLNNFSVAILVCFAHLSSLNYFWNDSSVPGDVHGTLSLHELLVTIKAELMYPCGVIGTHSATSYISTSPCPSLKPHSTELLPALTDCPNPEHGTPTPCIALPFHTSIPSVNIACKRWQAACSGCGCIGTPISQCSRELALVYVHWFSWKPHCGDGSSGQWTAC